VPPDGIIIIEIKDFSFGNTFIIFLFKTFFGLYLSFVYSENNGSVAEVSDRFFLSFEGAAGFVRNWLIAFCKSFSFGFSVCAKHGFANGGRSPQNPEKN
jgi:hypothetical protein